MLALIPLALQLVPTLARWLGGPDAETTTQRIADTVQAVVGDRDPAAVLADPEQRAQLVLALARIEAEREAARIEETRALLADTASARAQTVELARAGSPLAYGAGLVSAGVMALFGFAVIGTALGLAIPDLTMRLIEYAVIAVLGYWLGSSAGSARKDLRDRPLEQRR